MKIKHGMFIISLVFFGLGCSQVKEQHEVIVDNNKSDVQKLKNIATRLKADSADEAVSATPVNNLEEDNNSFNFVAKESLDESSIKIRKISYWGSGCSVDSVGISMSPDKKSFTLIYDQFSVSSDGVDQGTLLKYKGCLLKVQIEAPRNWVFGLMENQIRGYVSLDDGADLRLHSYYSYNPFLGFRRLHRQLFEGPLDDDFMSQSEASLGPIWWSPYGRKLRNIYIYTSLLMKTKNEATGFASIDSQDGLINQEYRLVWKNVPADPVKSKV